MNFKNWPYQLKFGFFGIIFGIVLGILLSILFFMGGPYNAGPGNKISSINGLQIFKQEPRLAIEIIVSVSFSLAVVGLIIGIISGYIYKKIKKKMDIA